MKARTSFLKRCIALVLAVMLMVSGTNMGIVLQALAAGNEITVQIGQIVADNYDLTAQEKDLLKSGNLASGTYSYTEPDSSKVTVDNGSKTITAAAYGDWIPTKAYIKVGENVVETVELTNGVGIYAYDENAFSVEVDYTLDIEVDKAEQERLLNTAGWLKAGVANVDKLVAESSALSTLELAMPELLNLADNGYEVFGNKVTVVAEVADAIHALNDQMTENGHLTLVIMQENYAAGKTNYLLNNGLNLKAELESTRENVNWVNKNLTDIKNIISSLGESFVDAGTVKLINTLQAIVNGWVIVADAVIAGDWTAAEEGVTLVSANVDYAKLDELVKELGATSAPAAKNPLHVADVKVKVNMNMKDVTVKVVLKVVTDEADSAALVVHGESAPVVLTLSAGASKQDILDAVAAANVEADALAAWSGVYVAEHFESSASALPDTLEEDTAYVITYAPKSYTVNLSYGAALTVPYGYKYTLPKHSDPAQAYDYNVNGTKMSQGSVYTVVGNTEINRSVGKAYTGRDLYSIIAENYASGVSADILNSGALKNNVSIYVRKPDPTDADSMIKLEEGKLTVEGKYAADYEDLDWVPYSYGSAGDEHKFGFEETEVEWDKNSVKVMYILTLENFSKDKVDSIQKSVVDLKEEAAAQKETLDKLAAYHAQMLELDQTKLSALTGVIKYANMNADSAKNELLKAEFTAMLDGILSNNMEGTQLKICNMLGEYKLKGLTYYYNNSAHVIDEINSLSGYLSGLLKDGNGLTADEKLAALTVLITDADLPTSYLDKITDLERIMGEVQAALTAPNALIDLNSANLSKLIEALESEDAAEFVTSGHPYLISETLTAADNSTVMVQVIAEVGDISQTFTTEAQPRGYILTQGDVNVLVDSVEAFAEQQLGNRYPFYHADFSELADMVGTELTQKQTNVYITYGPVTYTITIEGVGDKSVTIDSRDINLPGHGTKGWVYTYDVFGTPVEVAYGKTESWTLTFDDFKKIAEGNTKITRTETNKAGESLEDTDTIKIEKDALGNPVSIVAKVDPATSSLVGFAQDLVLELGGDYPYIELNDETLLENAVISLQTLINAIMNDNSFGSDTLISVAKNNGGKVFSGKLNLGNSKDDIMFSGVDFTFTLNSAPGAMKKVANGLEKIKPYMTFKSDNGVMKVAINMPEKVYEAYLTALLATGVVDKDNIAAIDAEIAYQYLYDYVDLIINTDATTTSFTNTLTKLGQSYDLTGAEEYYQMVKKALTNDGISINPATDGKFDMSVNAVGQKAINGLFDLIGMAPSDYQSYVGLIKEYGDGEMLTATAVATLENTTADYEALILDLNAEGVLKKFDYTENLPKRSLEVTNQAAVILLGSVHGNLSFPGTTILDLNGYSVNGSITAGGDLYIVDSRLETASDGYVSGSVSGKTVTIFGGKYEDNVSSYLKDGYKQVDKVVQNVLFTVKDNGMLKSGTTNLTYVVNTDILDEGIASYTTFAKALAVDIAVDMALNYFTAASLAEGGKEIYAINFNKLIALMSEGSKVDKILGDVVNSVNADGISAFANKILADLLDFGAIDAALQNPGTTVGDYNLTTAPWTVNVEHVVAGDYIDFGIGASEDADLAKKYNVKIAFEGDNATLKGLVGELAKIAAVSAVVTLDQPTYANKTVNVAGGAQVNAAFDMTGNADYATMIAVILAYGNPAKSADVKAAVDARDTDGLKTVIDNTTVAEVFTAMKKLSRTVDFQAMADAVGVTRDMKSVAELEAIYHLTLCASGKLLEDRGITGRNSKLGGLYDEATEEYVLTKKDIFAEAEYNNKISAHATIKDTAITLKVKLYGDDCLWGDMNHDDIIDPDDATLILEYFVGLNPVDFCLIRADLNDDGAIDPDDATLILEYFVGLITKFPVELK